MAASLFFLFLAAVMIGIPICFSLMLSATVSLFAFSATPAVFTVQKIFTSLDSFSMMAIPFFMIAGGLFDKGGVSKRLVRFANALVGWLPGGLAIVTFVASAFFGAISGSASATVAAIGSIMIPYLLEEGYSLKFSLSTVACAGFLGIIIPPSIPMVIYSIAASASVGDVFTGGFIPGFMLVAGMSVYALIYGKKHVAKTRKFDPHEVWSSFTGAIWALLMPLIILGGIYGGIFTPTEAAGVACVYGLFVDLLEKGYFQKIMDTQCFDLAAVRSIRDDPRHQEIACGHYADMLAKSCVASRLTAVMLGATEIDADFNVNIHTDSNGRIMGGSGGHTDIAHGAKLTGIPNRAPFTDRVVAEVHGYDGAVNDYICQVKLWLSPCHRVA